MAKGAPRVIIIERPEDKLSNVLVPPNLKLEQVYQQIVNITQQMGGAVRYDIAQNLNQTQIDRAWANLKLDQLAFNDDTSIETGDEFPDAPSKLVTHNYFISSNPKRIYKWSGLQWVYIGSLEEATSPNSGQILLWHPNTQYYQRRLQTDEKDSGPDIVRHGEDLYRVVKDFTSTSQFSEYQVSTEAECSELVLSKITQDIDLDYLEIAINGIAPFPVDEEIAAYVAVRPFSIEKTHHLPNLRHAPINNPKFLHKGLS